MNDPSHRVSIDQKSPDLLDLVDRACADGVGIDLERGGRIVATLTPASTTPTLRVSELNAFLANLPKLGDDADDFLEEMRALRRALPAETNPWD
jgi:antitoxin (DNA-binding transcriptional repressor) of toxin-antitoxin stability system